jgi:hypothetical protein
VYRVKGFQHLEVLETLPQGVHARVFLKRCRVMESSKGFEAFEVAEVKCSNVGPQEDEFSEERRSVRVLGGESMKSREPSDLTEK